MTETTLTNVHRVTLLVVDHDHLGAPDVGTVVAVETRAVDWHDGHPLNQRAGWREAYTALFAGAAAAGFVPDPTAIAALRRLAFRADKPALTVDDLAGGRRQLPYDEVAPVGKLAVDLLNWYDSPAARDGRRELANLRAVAGALYAKLLQTAARLGKHESTAALEIDLAKVHVELGKLGVV